jgi:hypothetical protein
MTTTYFVKCLRVGIYLKGQCSMVILLARFCTLKSSCAREHGISYWRICKKSYFLWKVDHFMLITSAIFLLKNVNCCPRSEVELLLVCLSFIKFEDKKMVLEFSLTCTWTKFNKDVLIHIGIPLREFICFVSMGVIGPQKAKWFCTNSLLDELGISTYTS